jgi:predicted Fe-Mo cluster-binding NifX family protein
MKICVTSEGKTMDSNVDPRFGRCRNFIFFDTDTGKFEAQENPNTQLQGGAGIQSGQLMVSKGVNAVLTGKMGPNAQQVISAAGIDVITGASGTVKEAIEKYWKK